MDFWGFLQIIDDPLFLVGACISMDGEILKGNIRTELRSPHVAVMVWKASSAAGLSDTCDQ